MRAKSPIRLSTSRGVFTFTPAMELCGVTGDFIGGFVQVNAFALECNPGAGAWISLQAMVDGVIQGPSRLIWQATGQNNVQVGIGHTARVPPGRHRVSVQLTSSNASAWSSNGGYIEVLEN
jgi:hypothetical protein